MGSSGITPTHSICFDPCSDQRKEFAKIYVLTGELCVQVVLMAGTQQKVDTKPVPDKTNTDMKEVSQDGFDYVLNAMNGEDNMKEETKDYKPTKTWGSYFFGSSKK